MIIVEDDAFVQILQMLNANVAIPSRVTVSRDIQAVFDIAQAHVKKYLLSTVGRKHAMLDGWSSPNVLSVLGFAITFLDKNNEMASIVLDCIRSVLLFVLYAYARNNVFCRLTKSHTGAYLAEKVAEILKEYGLVDLILGMALDNASNNDKMLVKLPDLLPSSATVGTDYQIRCWGHIMNLCCKAFLSLFDISPKAIEADKGPSHAEDLEVDDESDEDEDLDDDVEVVEDQQEERDTGDWLEIGELCASLTEVALLDVHDKVVGRNTMKKVCV
jgi:hypothetical protein